MRLHKFFLLTATMCAALLCSAAGRGSTQADPVGPWSPSSGETVSPGDTIVFNPAEVIGEEEAVWLIYSRLNGGTPILIGSTTSPDSASFEIPESTNPELNGATLEVGAVGPNGNITSATYTVEIP